MFESTPAADLEIAWRTPLQVSGAQWLGTPAIVDDIAIVEVGDALRAYSVGDGALVWSTRLRNGIPINGGNIVVASNTAVIAGADSVYAVRTANGARAWAVVPPAQAALGEIAADENAVFIGTRAHEVLALDIGTGAELWRADVGAEWDTFGIVTGVARGGDTVYVGAVEYLHPSGSTRRGHVIALDRATGTEYWRFTAGGDQNDVSSAPLVAGTLVYASDLYGGSVFAVDRFTGQEVWRTSLDGLGPSHAPIDAGRLLVLGANNGFAYGLEATSGAIRWRTDTGGSITGFAVCGDLLLLNNTELHAVSVAGGHQIGVLFTENQDEFLWSNLIAAQSRAVVVGNLAAYGIEC